ncbi:MAG: 50S ribosomal protein L9 [Candidatus Berkelbacteria bacterium]|nr:50S ribosomal protein L9 [Candidatus Berkelbacteria bacterium]
MRVIFTSNIKNIGQKGEIKEVKPGYARNFLFPKNLAVTADSVIGQEIIAKKESEAEKQQETIGKVAEIASKNQNLVIDFQRKASSEGKLFGSVTIKEIKTLAEEKLKVKIESISPNLAIKEIGDHKINLALHGQQTLDIIVKVSALAGNKK